MTKQDEIREKIEEIFRNDTQYPSWDKATDAVLNYLHSQGVVIKVEKELPTIDWMDGRAIDRDSPGFRGYQVAQQQMLNAGYVAVEPLI